jgi:hypothetical protein
MMLAGVLVAVCVLVGLCTMACFVLALALRVALWPLEHPRLVAITAILFWIAWRLSQAK